MAYRVGELADAAGVTVELIRSYQTKGLLDSPRRNGRVALYDDRHLDRLKAIQSLKDQGYSLKAIGGMLDRQHRADPDRPMTAVLSHGPGDDAHLDIHELAEKTRVPLALLRSLEASGVIRARRSSGSAYYTAADVRAVRMLLTLIGVGLPMEDFMRLARLQMSTMQEVAAGAVELYSKYVEVPLSSMGLDQAEVDERSEAAFNLLLQATTSLLAYSFERILRSARASARGGGGE